MTNVMPVMKQRAKARVSQQQVSASFRGLVASMLWIKLTADRSALMICLATVMHRIRGATDWICPVITIAK